MQHALQIALLFSTYILIIHKCYITQTTCFCLSITICSVEARLLEALVTYGYSSIVSIMCSFGYAKRSKALNQKLTKIPIFIETMRNTLCEFFKLSRHLHFVPVVAEQASLALGNAKVSCKHGLWLVALRKLRSRKKPVFQVFCDFFTHERAGIRTPDNLIKSQVLYRLSYTPSLFYIVKLGQLDSNQRMQESKSCALPLGDGPIK